MFGGFADLFNFGFTSEPAHGAAPQQPPTGKAPPTSRRALATLPMVKVTADDILEVTNKECLICLEEQKIGAWAVKLQCGHLFHKDCVYGWLEQHCTCPVCRFELETDDQSYEQNRKQRMKKRKLRLRKDEIQNKTISQLRELAGSLNVNIQGCLDKVEVVDKLVKSGFIEITEGLPPIEMFESELNSKTVAELKYLLLSFGLPDRNLLEKSELRQSLINSGRIVFKPETKPSREESNDSSAGGYDLGAVHMDVDTAASSSGYASPSSSSSSRADAKASAPAPASRSASASSETESSKYYYTLLADLKALPLGELRELCARFGVSVAGCLYKADVVDRLVQCEHVRILPVEEQLAAKADYSAAAEDMSVQEDGEEGNQQTSPAESKQADTQTASPHRGASFPYSFFRGEDAKGGGMSSTSSMADAKGTGSSPSSEKDSEQAPPTPTRGTYSNVYDTLHTGSSSSSGGAGALTSLASAEEQDPHDHRMALSDALLNDMSVREIRSIMQAYGIDGKGCLEKEDMIRRVKACSLVRIVAD